MEDLTPPPELVQQWFTEQRGLSEASRQQIATRAAQWGADQELEACCEWGNKNLPVSAVHYLRAARRPKPSSLKERLKVALWNEDLGTALRLVEQIDD
jgi:hypothetical protein